MLSPKMGLGKQYIQNPVSATAGFARAGGRRIGRFLHLLGPGLITGAADDDPSGIATYSQAGAQFGMLMPWTMLFTYPLMTAVQEACMRIGAVRGQGLAGVIRDNFGRKLLFPMVLLVVVANTINIGADIGAMAGATQLVINLPFWLITIFYTGLIVTLVIYTSYRTIVKLLKWLVLALLAYPLTAFIVGVPWGEVIQATLTPRVEWSVEYLFILVGVLGTTISPYLFFWQTSEVVEEEISKHRLPQDKIATPKVSHRFLRNLRIDNAVGMLISNLTAWFIIVTAAVVLHAGGVKDIATAADAARALEPLVQGFPNAGLIARSIFAIGIVGLGLLAVPVLAGSASYAISEAVGWKEGLFRPIHKARGFYGVILAATITGLGINFVHIDPMKALVWTAVANGIAAVPLLLVIAIISSSPKIMGEYVASRRSKILVWLTFIIMGLAAGALLISFV